MRIARFALVLAVALSLLLVDGPATDPHQKCRSNQPASSGPSAVSAPPIADQRAIDRVRAGPDHSAVINASVVGNAIPAANPPRRRANIGISIRGANAARRQAGIEIPIPRRSIILRPYRSPRAPR